MFAHSSPSPGPKKRPSRRREWILNWNCCFRTHLSHNGLILSPWAIPGHRPVKKRRKKKEKEKTLSCYAHKTHPAKWQISMATRSGQLMSFRRQMLNEKNSPIRLSLLWNTWNIYVCMPDATWFPFVPQRSRCRCRCLWMDSMVNGGATPQNSSGCCMQICPLWPKCRQSVGVIGIKSLACSSSGAWPSACWHG